MNIKKFKVNGYLLVLETGEYSDYAEQWFMFDKMPNLDAIWKEIESVSKEDLGKDFIESIIEKYGGRLVPRIATIEADWKYAKFHNNITGKEHTREEREWRKRR